MLVNTKYVILKAKQNGYAVPQFNVNNLEWAKYILEECNNKKSPVILGISMSTIEYLGGYLTISNFIKALLLDLNITIPVCLHLDHAKDFESCKKAIDSGFSSVMIDASHLSLEENIKITKQVVEYAHKRNVSVEAEVGNIQNSDIIYTDLNSCLKLYNETKIDFLAPAIGNYHGIYKTKPNINFELVSELSEKLDIPLVLHGASGIEEQEIKKLISLGIFKININTDLQLAWINQVRCFLKENEEEYDLRKIIKSGEPRLKAKILEKIILLDSINKA